MPLRTTIKKGMDWMFGETEHESILTDSLGITDADGESATGMRSFETLGDIPELDAEGKAITNVSRIETDQIAARYARETTNRDLLYHEDIEGGTVDVTVGPFARAATSRYFEIEVLQYYDNEQGANNDLTLSFSGDPEDNSNHYYTLKDAATLGGTQQTGEPAMVLIRPTNSSSTRRFAGKWTVMTPAARPAVFGGGTTVAASSDGAETLDQGGALETLSGDSTNEGMFEMTLSASSGDGSNLRLEVAIWKHSARSDIGVQ